MLECWTGYESDIFKYLPTREVLTTCIPDPGSGAFLAPGSGLNIPDHISESFVSVYWIKNT